MICRAWPPTWVVSASAARTANQASTVNPASPVNLEGAAMVAAVAAAGTPQTSSVAEVETAGTLAPTPVEARMVVRAVTLGEQRYPNKRRHFLLQLQFGSLVQDSLQPTRAVPSL
jgi:hypothetical protein